jgi:hypothetical protein
LVVGGLSKKRYLVNNIFFLTFFTFFLMIFIEVASYNQVQSHRTGCKVFDVQGIFSIAAAIQTFIEGCPGRPDIILAVFHRMMLICLGGDSPPGFSEGMPPVASNVYTHMLAPDVPAKDISIYLHLSDAMLRELPPVLKASLLGHQLPPRMVAALSNKQNPDLRPLLHKNCAFETRCFITGFKSTISNVEKVVTSADQSHKLMSTEISG